MSSVEVSQEPFDVALMSWGRIVILSLEFRVSNKGFAVLTPVLWRRLPVFRHLGGWFDVNVFAP